MTSVLCSTGIESAVYIAYLPSNPRAPGPWPLAPGGNSSHNREKLTAPKLRVQQPIAGQVHATRITPFFAGTGTPTLRPSSIHSSTPTADVAAWRCEAGPVVLRTADVLRTSKEDGMTPKTGYD